MLDPSFEICIRLVDLKKIRSPASCPLKACCLLCKKGNLLGEFAFDQDRGPGWKPGKADVASSLNKMNPLRNLDCDR